MGALARFDQYRNQVLRSVNDQRIVLTGSGLILVLLSAGICVAPSWFAGPGLKITGWLVLGGGLLIFLHWLRGVIYRRRNTRGILSIAIQTLLLVAMGWLFVQNEAVSRLFFGFLLGLLLTVDGLTQFLIGLRQPGRWNRWLLFASGGATILVGAGGGMIPVLGLPPLWVIYLVAGRFFFFGAALVLMGLLSGRDDDVPVYGNPPESPGVEPVEGETYAVFFGPAFHLGVYVGNHEVVHFLESDEVRIDSWEDFLRGRIPQHWEYPDIAEHPPEEVSRFAREQAGKTFPYHFLRFNCEHFAVWCLSLGQTKVSDFSQVSVGIDSIRFNPILGSVIEVWSRVMEWVAFQFGGAYGKWVALQIRSVSSLVNRWLLIQVQHRRFQGLHG